MEMSDYKRFKELWNSACETALGKIPGETGLNLVFGALHEFPLDAIRGALIDCLRDSSFKPTPAAVIEQLTGGKPEDRATQAFGAVKKALRKINSGESVRFDDPCIHWALENGCGGWTGFARMDEVDSERIFTKYYASAVRLGKNWDSGDVPEHMQGKREKEGSVLFPWKPEDIVPVETRDFYSRRTQEQRMISA